MLRGCQDAREGTYHSWRTGICKDEEVRRCRAQDEGAGITTIRTRVIFVLVKNKTRLVPAARRTWVAEPVRLRRLTESARELSTGVANTQRLYAESTMSWRGAGNRSGAR
jgi:hypothetical protein